MTCHDAVPWEALVDHWCGEDGGLDEHVFGCPACTERLLALARLDDAVRRWTRTSRPRGGATPSLLDRLRRDRISVRGYDLAPGGSVRCTATEADDVVVLRLAADLEGASRVDILFVEESGRTERGEDVPVVRGREVVWCERAEDLLPLPAATMEVRLLAVDPGTERTVARYTLHHTPSR